MNLYLRFLWLLIRRFFVRPPMQILDPCDTSFAVNPFDLDVNFHMNNGRYLSIMDLGRVDLMLRAGVFGKLMGRGYYPVVASESIRFRQSLQLFQKFVLRTRIDSWDEKDIYLRQEFFRDGELIAEGFLKARFLQRGRKGSVPTDEIMSMTGVSLPKEKLGPLSEAHTRLEALLAPKGKPE